MKSERPYRILVVDDEASVHELFSLMLAAPSTLEHKGLRKKTPSDETGTIAVLEPPAPPGVYPSFEITFAFDGAEALECVRQAQSERRPYTMAFIDMRMPGGWNGIQTSVQIWKECFDLQIIICTGFNDFSWHDLIHEFGHSDRLLLLKKPFDLIEVRQVAYSLAEKWDLAHQAQSQMQRLQKLVSERTTKLQEANLSLQRKIAENKQAERRLVTQYSVTQALAQAQNLTDAVEIIFQIVCRSLNWDWGALWQVDAQANVLRHSKHWSVSEARLDSFAEVSRIAIFEPGGDSPGRAWSSGQPIWIRDVFLDPDFRRLTAAAQNSLHGAISFPINVGGKIFGVMEFLSREVRETEKDMLQTFAVIGSAIGQFIERKNAEEDLKKERDYTTQIIRETPALVMGIASDGTITFVNPSMARHTDYAEEELIGKNGWQLFYPGEEYRQVEQLFQDLKKGPVRDYEMVLATKNGAQRTVSWNSLSKFDEAGKLVELIGFGNDITERKRAESERSSMEIQLRHAQKMESIGQLAAGIAHEINTPTQYIGDNIRFLQTSFTELSALQARYEKLWRAAKENQLTPEMIAALEQGGERESLDFLMKEIPSAINQSLEGVERVGNIVRAMKDFSHPGTAEKTPINLNKAIETTLTVAGNEWKYIAKIETDFDPTLPLVPCLPGELNQVILNLVVNAAHAIADVVGNGKQLGTIKASTRRNGDWAEIRIQDTGTGIAEKNRGKIFDPFFTTKPVGKGTGQGLAISHTVIVDQHQGQLTFETETGVGTVFIIRLPLNPAKKPA